ncbi:DUF4861 family protein [Pseudocolwellia sp. HL-MZ19]|uniref:DUF4861 family protein n=1 Tax=Pseudocolwellia sp. HL-MZ19 TaxID=3400846 RepID=UPI003CF6E8A7
MNILSKILAFNVAVLITAGCAEQLSINLVKPTANKNTVEQSQQQIKAYAKYVPIREDDFTWENDLVAFRVYGPSSPATVNNASSGVDAWLKRVDYSIIDKWYNNFLNKVSYHIDWGEGYDPYHTGTSRGVGSTALWINNQPYPASTYNAWRIIDNNPKKVIFELDYAYKTPMGEVKEVKQISLALGSRLFEVRSSFFVNNVPAKNMKIAIGVTTHDEVAVASYNKDFGWVAAWENLDGYGLGTGVVISPEKIDEIKHIALEENDQSHIWIFSETDDFGKLNYAAGYGWGKAQQITTEQAWQQYLSDYPKD